jgi:hypothetical protein
MALDAQPPLRRGFSAGITRPISRFFAADRANGISVMGVTTLWRRSP